jgi:putative transposase
LIEIANAFSPQAKTACPAAKIFLAAVIYLLHYWSMANTTIIRSGRHCVFNIHPHLIFVTQYRKKIFSKNHLSFMNTLFRKICQKFDSEWIECDGDHVHLLIHYPPKIAVSTLVNALKGVSSRMLRKKFVQMRKFYSKGILWSPSYFDGSCGRTPISIIKQYIKAQPTPIE